MGSPGSTHILHTRVMDRTRFTRNCYETSSPPKYWLIIAAQIYQRYTTARVCTNTKVLSCRRLLIQILNRAGQSIFVVDTTISRLNLSLQFPTTCIIAFSHLNNICLTHHVILKCLHEESAHKNLDRKSWLRPCT